MNFCDYCTCTDCKNGKSYLSHAQTASGNWICDVCYTYDLCPNGPCADKNCSHRPKLISGFQK
jgi:hypothetical protein